MVGTLVGWLLKLGPGLLYVLIGLIGMSRIGTVHDGVVTAQRVVAFLVIVVGIVIILIAFGVPLR